MENYFRIEYLGVGMTGLSTLMTKSPIIKDSGDYFRNLTDVFTLPIPKSAVAFRLIPSDSEGKTLPPYELRNFPNHYICRGELFLKDEKSFETLGPEIKSRLEKLNGVIKCTSPENNGVFLPLREGDTYKVSRI